MCLPIHTHTNADLLLYRTIENSNQWTINLPKISCTIHSLVSILFYCWNNCTRFCMSRLEKLFLKSIKSSPDKLQEEIPKRLRFVRTFVIRTAFKFCLWWNNIHYTPALHIHAYIWDGWISKNDGERENEIKNKRA